MARILVGSVYFLRLDPVRWAEHQPFPPLGTLYAVSTLRDAGHETHFFDAMIAEGVEDWDAALRRVQPDIVVLFDDNFNYLSKMCLAAMRQAALRMIASAKSDGVKIFICSADASDHPEVYLDAGVDAVILGEGEATLREIVRHEVDFSAVKGVARRGSQGATVRTAARGLIRELDALPLPAWDLVNMDAYRAVWCRYHGFFALNVVTSRGCPYLCNWCAKPIWGQSYSVRSPAAVVNEIAKLVASAAPDYIWFMDDIMGLKPKWLRAFADELAAANVKVPFKCLSRADLVLRDDAAKDLRRAGCDIVWMGAESGSQKILDAMDKGVTTEQIAEATARLKRAGIRVGHFLQFGYPGEGMREISETLSLLRTTNPDELGISISYPLPGTEFYARVESQLREKRNWSVSSDMAMLYRGPFTTAFYRHLHAYVHREFRLRRAVRQLREFIAGRAIPSWSHARAFVFVLAAGLAVPMSWMKLQLLRLHPALVQGGRFPP